MGTYQIEIQAVGGHGCQREVDNGQIVYGCGRMDCPDCQAREFVAQLKRRGSTIDTAILVHWPNTESEVRDDLVSGKRSGSFNVTVSPR